MENNTLTIVNVIAKAKLEDGANLHGADKITLYKGEDLRAKIHSSSGRVLFTRNGALDEQACRDVTSHYGTITDFKIVNIVAKFELPSRLPLEPVAQVLDCVEIEDEDEEERALVYRAEACNVLIFEKGLVVFLGSADLEVYRTVLEERLLPVFERFY